jgi:demethoxyubiquinone hydroxylase (CLK1/Coq7/Cat5 family)
MDKTISSLKVMQRMERLAANVYKYQKGGFKGETSGKMQKAFENEKEHAGTLAETIRKHNGSPSAAGFLFGFAGGTAGVFTRLIGKKNLLAIDTWIEEMAVKDYTKFVNTVTFNQETLALLNRIIEDEKRHIENWGASIEALKK